MFRLGARQRYRAWSSGLSRNFRSSCCRCRAYGLGVDLREQVVVDGSPGRRELFVCAHNAGRSPMAAAFLTHRGRERVRVRSAGSAPADSVNPATLTIMRSTDIRPHRIGCPLRSRHVLLRSHDYNRRLAAVPRLL
ncbi:low molecular weight phosphatase family protein [Amycolatopsis sp. NPDC051903]|uniref:low molecular weight phosphatase family protein n=1 Tax=Amycolatopsis sp. NPDC051903 TaxID=3363936 RepID=UPI0037AC194F